LNNIINKPNVDSSSEDGEMEGTLGRRANGEVGRGEDTGLVT